MMYVLISPVNKDVAIQQVAGEREMAGLYDRGLAPVCHGVEFMQVINDHSSIASGLVVGVGMILT